MARSGGNWINDEFMNIIIFLLGKKLRKITLWINDRWCVGSKFDRILRGKE